MEALLLIVPICSILVAIPIWVGCFQRRRMLAHLADIKHATDRTANAACESYELARARHMDGR